VPPEVVFDQGLGDFFVIRTAREVVDNAVRENARLVAAGGERTSSSLTRHSRGR
jgi:carbonic anhydrase